MTDQELEVLLESRRSRLTAWQRENQRQRLAREQAAQERAEHAAFWASVERRQQDPRRAVLPMRGRR